MKVLHINTVLSGGAALCAQRIMNATAQHGVETKMLICKGEPHENIYRLDKDKSIWDRSALLTRFKNLLIKLNIGNDVATKTFFIYKTLSSLGIRELCHLPYSEYKSLADHPLIEWADVIHLHWVTGMLDYPTFFSKVKKPIVWTMHDKYPLAGMLHYVGHDVPDCLIAMEKECRYVKRKALEEYNNLYMVAISKMMVDLCKKSEVTNGLPVYLIHNGIEEEKFCRKEITNFKRELGIPDTNKVFLFSAFSIHDRNKGLVELINALELLNKPDTTLVCVGRYDAPPQAGIDIKCLGYVSDNNRLSQLYSLADYFVFSSFEESFGQTPLEAMACGTPVIAFPTGIISDLINEANGVVCSDFTVDALVEGIRKAMDREYDSSTIREDVINRFSYDKIAHQYIELYKSILNQGDNTQIEKNEK